MILAAFIKFNFKVHYGTVSMGALIIRSFYRVPKRKSNLLAWALPVRPVQGPL